MKNIHEKLAGKYTWYSLWHEDPNHHAVHSVLLVVALAIFLSPVASFFTKGQVLGVNTSIVITPSVSAGRIGYAYSTLLYASGGPAPYYYSLTSGNLPAGLSLASNGTISGTPSAVGTSNFTIQAADSSGNTNTQALSIQILGSLSGIKSGGLLSYPAFSANSIQIANGGFESEFTGWNVLGYGIDTSTFHGGSKSVTSTFNGFAALWQPLTISKAGHYQIDFWMKTSAVAGSGGSGVRVSINSSGFNNPYYAITDVINGTTDWTHYTAGGYLGTPGTYSFGVSNYGNPTGQIWVDDIQMTEQYFPLSVFLTYPNYRGIIFSDQSQIAKFNVAVTPPAGESLSAYTLSGTVTDENTSSVVRSTSQAAQAESVVSFDFTGLDQSHTYLATFTITRSNPSATYGYPSYRVTMADGTSRGAMTISFDKDNRFLFLGKPTFLLGVYDSGLDYTGTEKGYLDQMTSLRRLFELPINFYHNYWYGGISNTHAQPLLNLLQSRGIYSMFGANCVVSGPASAGYWFMSATDQDVQTRMAHPGAMGFYTADECITSLAPNVFSYYPRMAKLNPGGATWVALTGGNIDLWRDAADILSQDPYPFFSGAYGPYNLGIVSDYTKATVDAVKGSRPIATVIQFFQGDSISRWPTRDELRNMSYMAIADGANGLVYWEIGQGAGALAHICDGSDAYHSPAGSDKWCPARVDNFDNLKAVITEIADLQLVLSSVDQPNLLTSNTSSNIHTRVKFVNGTGYLIASNVTSVATTVTFGWTQAPLAVSVFNESRNINPSGNNFTDSFGPYQAHVYQINTDSVLSTPIISSFSASPSSLSSGQPTTLFWSVSGATSLSINNGVGDVTGQVSKVVFPTATTTYTLTATNGSGTVSADTTVSMGLTASTTIQPPTPTDKFLLNDRVKTNTKAKVRQTPTTIGKALCTQSTGILGTIIGGPQVAKGYTWWKVNYDSGCDGWSAQDYLDLYSRPTAVNVETPTIAVLPQQSSKTGFLAGIIFVLDSISNFLEKVLR